MNEYLINSKAYASWRTRKAPKLAHLSRPQLSGQDGLEPVLKAHLSRGAKVCKSEVELFYCI